MRISLVTRPLPTAKELAEDDRHDTMEMPVVKLNKDNAQIDVTEEGQLEIVEEKRLCYNDNFSREIRRVYFHRSPDHLVEGDKCHGRASVQSYRVQSSFEAHRPG